MNAVKYQNWEQTTNKFQLCHYCASNPWQPEAWCRLLLIMELCFLIEWVLDVQPWHSGGVRLGNLTQDFHLLGDISSCLLHHRPGWRISPKGLTHVAYQDISLENYTLFLSLMLAKMSIDRVTMTIKKQSLSRLPECLFFSAVLIKFLSSAFSFGRIHDENVVADCNL